MTVAPVGPTVAARHVRRARHGDEPAIAAFLRAHIQTSMFPLANLQAHGLNGSAPRAMRFWVLEDAGGLRGVYGETLEGMAMPQIPSATPADWDALCAAGARRDLIGALGHAGQVRDMLTAFDLRDRSTQHDADEPGFALDLADLHVPEGPPDTQLDRPGDADLPMITEWRIAYHQEVMGTPAQAAPAAAASDLKGYLARDTHRLLRENGRPVAFTGFNAVVDDTVQIGGVYTPPAFRGRGLARRAVALHLADARAKGFTRSVLFAASEAAARAYTAIGFTTADPFAMVLFSTPGLKAEDALQ